MSKTGLIKAAISLAALVVVVWVLPMRDVCVDPAHPDGGRSPLSRTESGCVLHASSGDRALDVAACASLSCRPGLRTTLAQARLGVVFALGLLPFVSSVVWSMRWRTLLGIGGKPPPLWNVWRITMESQAGGVLLPGSVGGDALRVAWATADGTPLGVVLGSVALDRAIGLTMLTLTAAALALGMGGLSAGPLAWALAGVPSCFLGGVLLLRSRLLGPDAAILKLVLRGAAGRALRPMLDYVRADGAPRAIGAAMALGLVLSVYQLGLIRGLVYALGATPTNELQVYVGTAMAFVVYALPALPGAWGTGDAAFVFFFAPAGLDAGVAFGTSMLYRLFWYSQALTGALVGLFASVRPKAAGRDPAADPPLPPRSHP